MFGDLTRVAAKQLGSDNQLQTKPVSQTSGQFQHMSVTYFAVHVLKCTDTYVQAHITFFVIMVILWNGCIFLYIALTMLLVYLNWVNLLCRSVWPHCPYMVQCNTVYRYSCAVGKAVLYWPVSLRNLLTIYMIYEYTFSFKHLYTAYTRK